ncbi:MAG: TetR/AcrR family transcriptional regulator [Desulfobacterales bacterium]
MPKNSAANSIKDMSPPSRQKINDAFRTLLMEKDFQAITTAELAAAAGVNQSLIFRHFENKKGLLYQVLADDFEIFQVKINDDLRGIKGAFNKLRKLIWSHMDYYDRNPVFAKIIVAEINSFSDYFESKYFQMTKSYSELLLNIIEEGVEEGEIRNDIHPHRIRQTILGGIEYICLPYIIYNRKIRTDEFAEDLFEMIFDGILRKS